MDFINTYATGGLGDIISFASNFLVLIVLTVVLFLFAMRAGRAVFTSLVIALYAGYGLYTVFPYKEMLAGSGGTVATASNLVLFLGLSFVPYLLLRKIATSGLMRINPLIMIILSVATAGFILVLGYQSFDLGSLLPLTPMLESILMPEQYFFWWLVAPLAGLFIAAR
ncbi:MAG: hypothetical protein AB199_02960 [Parcubacteria bacterium C7867-004]|nr:MAG: hypothetical protein AB199_02960 [Parcubacteria bacterium C7867-004]